MRWFTKGINLCGVLDDSAGCISVRESAGISRAWTSLARKAKGGGLKE